MSFFIPGTTVVHHTICRSTQWTFKIQQRWRNYTLIVHPPSLYKLKFSLMECLSLFEMISQLVKTPIISSSIGTSKTKCANSVVHLVHKNFRWYQCRWFFMARERWVSLLNNCFGYVQGKNQHFCRRSNFTDLFWRPDWVCGGGRLHQGEDLLRELRRRGEGAGAGRPTCHPVLQGHLPGRPPPSGGRPRGPHIHHHRQYLFIIFINF